VAAKAQKSLMEKDAFTIQRSKTGVKFTLSAEFRKAVIDTFSAEKKLEGALKLTLAFDSYKRLTVGKTSLPKFVHDYIDPTCPEKYGKPGSDTRKKNRKHQVFNRVEYLIYRVGRPALKQINERKG